MKKHIRVATLSIALFSSLFMFMATSQRANADFLSTFEVTVLASLETIEKTVLQLSTDIGKMADHILDMADEIGEMADRIVHTEELIVSMASDGGISSLITYPTEGTYVTATTPITITLSSEKRDYLLYISNNADMSGSTNALVQDGDTSIAWSRVADFATGDKLYIAIRTVDDNTSSDFSNTVMLNLN